MYTSGLSVSEFVLAADDGLHMLGIVQGGSVFHVGLLQALVYESRELTATTRAHQQVRRLALSRLEQEAARLGAHGVLGVSFRQRPVGTDGLEFWAAGTAVRLTQGEPPLRRRAGRVRRLPRRFPTLAEPAGLASKARHRA